MRRTNVVQASLLRATGPLMQSQHPHQLTHVHGAGFVRHRDAADPGATSFKPELPTADLAHTQVHLGLGTSAQDPYQRTLPNQPMRPQVSTLVTPPQETVPSPQELAKLGSKWGSMGYWLGGRYPRLEYYLRAKLIDVPPVPASLPQRLDAFVTKELPALCVSDDGLRVEDAGIKAEQWRTVLGRFQRLPLDAHDSEQFLARIKTLQREAVDLFKGVDADGSAKVQAVVGLLAQQAIAARNAKLTELLSSFTKHRGLFASGDAVWGVLLKAFEDRNELLVRDNDAVAALWEHAKAARLPDVKAPVATLLAIIATQLAESARPGGAAKPSRSLLEDVGALPPNDSGAGEFQHLSPETLARLVRPLLADVFANATPALAALLHDMRLFAAHGLVRLLLAADTVARAEMRGLAREVAEYFKGEDMGRSLLATLGKAGDAKARIWELLGLSGFRDSSVHGVVRQLEWPQKYQAHVEALLCDEVAAKSVRSWFENNNPANKEEALKKIDKFRTMMASARSDVAAKQQQCVRLLSTPEVAPAAVQLLKRLGNPLETLHAAEKEIAERILVTAPSPAPLLHDVLLEVSHAHPHWALDGILPTDMHAITDGACFEAVAVAFRILLRLTCPPQAGEALLKSRYRRRIGPVRLDDTCVNVPVEVGVAESYDNLMYKQYDHQGWYQRMRDVYFRNVSIRCKITDLRRLDAAGRPYVDLQTERRLRILADNRVGAGVIKLDSDKFEDQSDNLDFGTGKFFELMAEAKKAQLGREYWPTVEVKVRNPSGQTKLGYSVVDWDRIEKRSAKLYEKYRELKKSQLFVRPTDTWLQVEGAARATTSIIADADGYTADDVMAAMNVDGASTNTPQ